MTHSANRFRVATEADAPTVRELDNLAFGPGTQRAEPGELEAGVAAGDIHVLVQNSRPVGYLHADTSRSGRIYVAGVGVHPDFQGQGLGSALIDHMLQLLGDERHLTPVVTVTSPRNVRMLKALFRRGFSARWFLPNHFGPGHDRFGCQLLAAGSTTDHSPPVRIDMARLDEVCELMLTRGFRVSSLEIAGPASAQFELLPILSSDFLPADPPNHFVDPAEQHLEQLNQALSDRTGTSNDDVTW